MPPQRDPTKHDNCLYVAYLLYALSKRGGGPFLNGHAPRIRLTWEDVKRNTLLPFPELAE